MKILHITSHMGGGVGKAISDTVLNDTKNAHTILLLESPKNSIYADKCKKENISVLEVPSIKEIDNRIASTDVVILHWWDHPLMGKFFMEFPKVKGRYVIWIHVSGCTYPNVPFEFLEKFKRVLFTTPYSYEKYNSNLEQKEYLEKKSDVIYGLGELKSYDEKQDYSIHEKYIIGYVGTFTKSKLNNEFIQACERIIKRLKRVEFLMIGNMEDTSWILEKINEKHIEKYFNFTGFLPSIEECLKNIDVFGYPLNPFHFGSTENVILEAMSVGIPIVCLNQSTEKYIIDNEKNGLLADNMEDYVEKIIKLCEDRELAKQLGESAKNSIKEKYNLKDNIEKLNFILEPLLAEEKIELRFEYETIEQYFLNFVGENERKFLLNCSPENVQYICNNFPIFCEQNKSSFLQFYRYFPEDEWIRQWQDAIIRYNKK